MAELAPVVFVLVFATIMSLPVWLLVRTLRRNRALRDPTVGEALAKLAADKRWHYSPRDDTLIRRFDKYPFDRGGRHRPAYDVVAGTHHGRSFTCFQYAPRRKLPAGEYSAEVDYLRVFVVPLHAPVPFMLIDRTRSTPLWMRRYTVGDDAFDRAFIVGTEDTEFADWVLTEALRRWLLDNPPPGPVRLLGTDLIGWHADTVGFDPQTLVRALTYLNALIDRIPLSEYR